MNRRLSVSRHILRFWGEVCSSPHDEARQNVGSSRINESAEKGQTAVFGGDVSVRLNGSTELGVWRWSERRAHSVGVTSLGLFVQVNAIAVAARVQMLHAGVN